MSATAAAPATSHGAFDHLPHLRRGCYGLIVCGAVAAAVIVLRQYRDSLPSPEATSKGWLALAMAHAVFWLYTTVYVVEVAYDGGGNEDGFGANVRRELWALRMSHRSAMIQSRQRRALRASARRAFNGERLSVCVWMCPSQVGR